jgi:predicted RNA-binding protein with RPS1 domain
MNKKENTLQDFSWELIEAQDKQLKGIPNPELLKKYGARVWNHTPQAEDLYLMYTNALPTGSKEPRIGECLKITSITSVNDREMMVMLSGMIDAVISLEKEKSFFRSVGMTKEEFVDWISTEEARFSFLSGEGRYVIVENTKPYIIASLSAGHVEGLKKEFFDQIKDPTSAYIAKIIKRNGGGFLVNVNGVEGFLPGSLAAANIVRDFDSMLGKETYVMVEDYLKDAGTFVFSHKKYLTYILPSKIAELSLEEQYTGTVTGTAKFGIFVEFNEIFTGLIHTSKMTPEMRTAFKNGEFSPGNEVSFWIKEITSDKKIILTDEDPSIRMREIEEFKEKHLGVITGGEVVSIQPFGTLVKLQKDIVGLISQKEIKTKKKKYTVGDHVMVNVERVHNDKIFLTIPNED